MEPEVLDKLLTKVGGKFKLVALYQKRMRELVRGLPPLIESQNMDPWDITTREIMNNKAELIVGEEAERIRKEQAAREAEEAASADKKKAPPAAPAPAPAPAITPAPAPEAEEKKA